MSDLVEDTVELPLTESFAEKFFAPVTPPLQIEFGATTHPGNVRPRNEDHYAVVKRIRSSEVMLTSLPPEDLVFEDDYAYGMVVADGIGGAAYGEFASRLALRTMLELAGQATSWVMRLTDLDAQQVQERVEAHVQRIQSTLREHTEADPKLEGMGTTWTSAHFLPPHAVIAHIGDSRAYLLREGQLTQITRDETMAQAFIDSGMEPDSVKKFGHILLNSFGSGNDDVSAQIHQIEFGPGDQLLLCTDGLTDMVPEEDIAQELQRHTAAQAACEALVSQALDNGGKDNVTVVLAVAAAGADS